MTDPKVFDLSVQSFTADKLEIKVKNISGDALKRALSIEFYAPTFLMNSKINDAAKAAATNLKPIGVASLAGVVSGPDSWSVWARRDSSDTSVVIALFNDLDQSGNDLATPIKLAAGAEFIIRIPLNPQANRATVNLVYSYQHGDNEDDKRIDGKLELQSGEIVEWTPDVRLTTNQASPTTITAGNLVKIFWHVKDGVSATLRGPLPGGNSELALSSNPQADFKISDGSLEIRVVSSMTYILQAEVKGPDGKPNVQVVRMLSLDTKNNKYTYLAPRPRRVLPYGLIEIDWAAWGVKKVIISVSGHTTRTINLTQQTLGRFYEGSGVMRVTATKEINHVPTVNERITLDAPPEDPRSKTVEVIPWMRMTTTPELEGFPMGLAVIAPKIALLTSEGLHIAEVGEVDATHFSEKLAFSKVPNPNTPLMWLALTAVDQRFVCLRMLATNADFEIVPFTLDGKADEIPPLTLPPEINSLGSSPKVVFDFVGFGGRAYFVVETPKSAGTVRRAYSVAFNSQTRKADLRPEPLLEPLIGYRLVSFDDGLYALNRNSGLMLRFDLTKTGTLEPPRKAASAVKKGEGAGAKEESMVKDGVLVSVGRLLVVLSPTSVPPVSSLERFGQQNTLRYTSTSSSSADIPQDLVYNPQKDYWARCGHDLDVKADTKAAFRGGESVRLWVIQPDNQVQTLAAGEETLFAPDYVFDFPSKPLPPYVNKQRQFKITNNTGLQLLPLNDTLRKAGLTDFGVASPAELTSRLPDTFPSGTTETFEFKYHDTESAPINLRFLLPRKDGVKPYYLLELTFSGPDLSTAKSVFQRVVVNERGSVTSIAEIPETATQHSTNNAVVIPPPKRLIEGVKLRAGNRTTIQLWREAPEAKDRLEVLNRYLGDEIRIAYDTPAFFFSAYGAGQLHINVDFALPLGIEISPSSQPQLKLIRINTDKSNGLHPELLPEKDDTTYWFKIGYLLKQELKAVYIGDGVATEKGDAIYLPVAHNSVQAIVQVWKINPENLSTSSTTNVQIQSTGVFSTPNSIALSDECVFAMFGDLDIHVLDYSLQYLGKANVSNSYTVVTGIKGYYQPIYFLLGLWKDKVAIQDISFHHIVGLRSILKSKSSPGKLIFDNSTEVRLDAVKGFREQNRMAGYPAWVSSRTVSPMAISTSFVSGRGERVKEVAVCIDGGMFTVGSTDKTIRELALESAGREEEIVYGREGKTIYCLHSQGDNQGLRVSRVDNNAWKQTHGLSLPRGDGVVDLTTDTRQRQPGTPYKNQRSVSMVISRDEKWLFVSHGRSIFKIDVAKMELRETYTMELPCRVFHVWSGKPTESHIVYGTPLSCILLYAIGASYRGNGFEGKEFKTHLYKLAIPDQ